MLADDDADEKNYVGVTVENRQQTGQMAEQDETGNHYLMAVRLNPYISTSKLSMLLTFFHISACDRNDITSFHELWCTLTRYETIRPGEYSQMKRGLSAIEANDCLSALESLEQHGPQSKGESRTLEIEKQRRIEAEKALRVAKTERAKSAKGHRKVIQQTEKTMGEIVHGLEQEHEFRIQQLENQLKQEQNLRKRLEEQLNREENLRRTLERQLAACTRKLQAIMR